MFLKVLIKIGDRKWHTAWRIVALVVVFVSLLSMFLGSFNFLIDLFSHFQLQYFVALVLLTIFFIWKKDYLFTAFLFLYSAFIFVFALYPLQLFAQDNFDTDVFFINSYYFNGDTEMILDEIKSRAYETVAFVEANQRVVHDMAESYGDPLIYNAEPTDSCAVFSKKDALDANVVVGSDYSMCRIKFEDYTLLVIHPMPPLTPKLAMKQKNFFQEIKNYLELLEGEGEEFILVGDFNSTYFSANFRKYFGQYFEKNIYSWSVFTPIMIPIDHALSNIDHLKVSRGKTLSSDHVPLLIDIPSQ